MRRLAGALRLEVGNVFRAIEHDEHDLADDLLDLADGLRRQNRLRLRVTPGRRRAGKPIDEIAGQVAPFGALFRRLPQRSS